MRRCIVHYKHVRQNRDVEGIEFTDKTFAINQLPSYYDEPSVVAHPTFQVYLDDEKKNRYVDPLLSLEIEWVDTATERKD